MSVPILAAVILAAAVRAGAAGARQPPLRYTVSPVPVKGGVEISISIPAFGPERLICGAFIPGTDTESDERPCGPQAAVLRMTPTELSKGKVYIGVTACTGSRRAAGPSECWSYGADVASGLSSAAGAASAASGAAPPPAAVGLADTAPPLLRSAAPAAPAAPAAGQGHRWSAEAKPEPAPKPGGRRFRGHDGRVYVREDPAAGSAADKDERYRRALAEDPKVRAAYEGWRGLDDAGRLDALQRMSDIQAEVYGVAPSQVVLKNGGKPGELAHYSTGDRKLTMNTASPYYNSPSMQINAVSHEARHRWQHGLVERLPSPGFSKASRSTS